MTQEITKQQKIIYMKSGLPIFVDIDRVGKLEEILSSGSGHKFVKLDDRVINSAEIEGIYTVDQYDEIMKIKQGEWRCVYNKWHKRREECECKREQLRKQRDAEEAERRRQEEAAMNMTPEEKAASAEKSRVMFEEMAIKGPLDSFFRKSYLIGSRSGRTVRRSTINAFIEKHGPEAALLDGLNIEENV